MQPLETHHTAGQIPPESSPETPIEHRTLLVKGMTCSTCVNTIENRVRKLDGIVQADVNFATEKLELSFHPEKIGLDAIRGTVAAAGYEAEEDIALKEVVMPVQGMTCAACVSRVEKVIGKLEGVHAVSVNLISENATIRYNPGQTRLSEIKQRVIKAGYTPLEITQQGEDDGREARRSPDPRERPSGFRHEETRTPGAERAASGRACARGSPRTRHRRARSPGSRTTRGSSRARTR